MGKDHPQSFGFSKMHFWTDLCIFCCFLSIQLFTVPRLPKSASFSALTSYLHIILIISSSILFFFYPKNLKKHKNSQFQLFFSFRSHFQELTRLKCSIVKEYEFQIPLFSLLNMQFISCLYLKKPQKWLKSAIYQIYGISKSEKLFRG